MKDNKRNGYRVSGLAIGLIFGIIFNHLAIGLGLSALLNIMRHKDNDSG